MDNKGKLIVIEGACDSVGKTTQSELLEKRLIEDGNTVIKHHFHSRGEDEGKLAQNYLDGKYGILCNYSAEWVHNLYAVDRQIIWPTKLKPEYDKGSVILLDRYTTSTLIYQGAMKKTKEELINFIEYVKEHEDGTLEVKEPDQVIFLYADFDLAMKLKSEREKKTNTSADLHESNLSYMRKVYDTAMFLADYLKWSKVKCDEGDHMRPIEDIHEDVYRLVKKMDN